MTSPGHRIMVIGTSAGGLEALDRVIGGLPPSLPASIFIVQHLDPDNSGAALLDRLGRYKGFSCKLAEDGEVFKKAGIYIAPTDYHLLIKNKTVLVRKGARENRYRPAIDPLFRSAAVAHGPAVIGVILTGLLDDGTAGLLAVKKCGGIAVVQDPRDAAYPAMPQSVLNHLKPDHCLPAAQMGRLLGTLVRRPAGRRTQIPDDIRTEALIAERVLSDVARVDRLGERAAHNCPNCGGVLWEMDSPAVQRYRCHTGHSFTASTLLASQSEKIEETLWICLRMLEERKNLLTAMAGKETRPGAKKAYKERILETGVHVAGVRDMLLTRNAGLGGDVSSIR